MTILENKIPPPIVTLIFGALMWCLADTPPALPFTLSASYVITALLYVTGLGFMLAGVISFKRADTTVNPLQPETATSLVTSGVYRFTRNPMYLGLVFLLMGWGVYLDSWIALTCIFPYMLFMQWFQIFPEEKALRALFAQDFINYIQQVRRWL